MSTPNELQRFRQEVRSNENGSYVFGVPDDRGEWVRFSKVEPLIRSHEALREALEQTMSAFVTKEAYPEFEADKDRFVGMATIETRAHAALAAAKEVGK